MSNLPWKQISPFIYVLLGMSLIVVAGWSVNSSELADGAKAAVLSMSSTLLGAIVNKMRSGAGDEPPADK